MTEATTTRPRRRTAGRARATPAEHADLRALHGVPDDPRPRRRRADPARPLAPGERHPGRDGHAPLPDLPRRHGGVVVEREGPGRLRDRRAPRPVDPVGTGGPARVAAGAPAAADPAARAAAPGRPGPPGTGAGRDPGGHPGAPGGRRRLRGGRRLDPRDADRQLADGVHRAAGPGLEHQDRRRRVLVGVRHDHHRRLRRSVPGDPGGPGDRDADDGDGDRDLQRPDELPGPCLPAPAGPPPRQRGRSSGRGRRTSR